MLGKIDKGEIRGWCIGGQRGAGLALDPPVGLSSVDIRIELVASEGQLLINHLCQIVFAGGSVPVCLGEQASGELIKWELHSGIRWLEIPSICIKTIPDVLKTQVEMVAGHRENLVLN